MARNPNFPGLDAYLKEQAAQAGVNGKPAGGANQKAFSQTPPSVPPGKRRKSLLRRRRAGVLLDKEEVKEIKIGRKKLRKQLRAKGIKSKREFEMVAGSRGLYFDKSPFLLFLWRLFGTHGLWVLLGLLGALLLLLFIMSLVTQMRGHFTIHMSDGMFREGFTLSETVGFENPATRLYAVPAEDVPCISIRNIPEDIDRYDGEHNDTYFAYTFYIRNEGESAQDYDWWLNLNSESRNLSTATWVMVFEDGEMAFYAKRAADGGSEALPAFDDNSRGYPDVPLVESARAPEQQYQVIATKGDRTFYRVIPIPFESEDRVVSGRVNDVQPMQAHKYTVVIWLEGDDPDCTDALAGGHLGLDVQFKLVDEVEQEAESKSWWQWAWENLKWWN